MNRYFLEVSYLGTGYAGFQVQQNAPTIQSEVERALEVLLKTRVLLTGSSRTDAGVHAEQNYFHFDWEEPLKEGVAYNMNALLPAGIAVRQVRAVTADGHCRFDAWWRQYRYVVYRAKNPFLAGRGYSYPYRLELEKLQAAANMVVGEKDFAAFSKRRSQVKTTVCRVMSSEWVREGECWVYRVRANRFLRGMVRGLVGTMLRVGRGIMTVDDFERVMKQEGTGSVDFSVPGGGLCLERVEFDEAVFVGEKK